MELPFAGGRRERFRHDFPKKMPPWRAESLRTEAADSADAGGGSGQVYQPFMSEAG